MRILIVEDDPEIVELIANQLEAAGFASERVDNSAQEALHALVKHRYDLMLLDRRLPDGDGIVLDSKVSGAPTRHSHIGGDGQRRDLNRRWRG